MDDDSIKKTTLLLCDKPKFFFRTLCHLKENELIDISIFWRKMNELAQEDIENKRTYGKKQAEDYFYFATTFKLLNSKKIGGRILYSLNDIARSLCTIYNDPKSRSSYQKTLASLLLSNPKKGKLFKDFLLFIEKTSTKKDIQERFNPATTKTLIAWSLEAGLIFKSNTFVGPKLREGGRIPSLVEFWESLKSVYNDMQYTGILGVSKVFVNIDEIRHRMVVLFNLDNSRIFDQKLTELLTSKYSTKILLHGAPKHIMRKAEEKDEVFKYEGKNYLYMSMR